MKKIMMIAASLAMVAGLASCQKENIIDNGGNGDNIKTGTITATFSKPTTKVIYNEVANEENWDLQPHWEVGDIIVGINSANEVFELKVRSVASEVATLDVPSEYVSVCDGSVTLFYRTGLSAEDWDSTNKQFVVNLNSQKGDKNMPAIMMATGTITSGTGEFTFNNSGAVLGISNVGTNPKGKTITQVTLYGKNLASSATLKYDGVTFNDPNSGYNVISTEILSGITVKDNGDLSHNASDNHIILMAVPAGSTVEKVFIKTADNRVFSLASTNKDPMNANIYRYIKDGGFKRESSMESPILTGVYSVAADKQMFFSKGNLQAKYDEDKDRYEWGFAANQYEYIGNNPGNTSIESQTDNAVVDLFGWSTNKTNYGISTSKSNDYYSGSFNDWGKAIDNNDTWCTLSKDEWSYLFNSEGFASDVRKDKYKVGVTVCGKTNCVVLLPDGWQWDNNTVGDNWKAEYGETTTVKWATMEAAGAVCLPSADQRDGASVWESSFNYWSSSEISGDRKYYVHLKGNVPTCGDIYPYYGYSVRLITDCK